MKNWGVVLKIEPVASGPFPHMRFVRVLISARRTTPDGTVLVQSLILPEADAAPLRVGRIASVAVEMDADPLTAPASAVPRPAGGAPAVDTGGVGHGGRPTTAPTTGWPPAGPPRGARLMTAHEYHATYCPCGGASSADVDDVTALQGPR